MNILSALLATAVLFSSAPACSSGGWSAQTPHATVPLDGQKSLPDGPRFSRESRAMQACWARASELGSPTVPGLGLRNEGGFVIRGSIEPRQDSTAGSPRLPRLSFECEVGLDGVVTRFIAR